MDKIETTFLTDDQIKLLPTEDDILLYEKNGWYISPIIFSEEQIDNAVKGAKRFYKGERIPFLTDTVEIANDESDPDSAIRNNEFVTLQNKELHSIGFNPLLGAIAAKLAQTDEIRLFADSLIDKQPVKPTSKGVVGWHSDRAYWPTCSSNKLLTAWIPMQDCTEDMGPVVHIDESHKWKDEEKLKSFFSFNNQDLSAFEKFLDEEKKGYKKSLMTLKKGQVAFHNCHTIHSSYPNKSDRNRMALAVHLQDKENKYEKAYKDNGDLIRISYDKLCKKDDYGNPDYTDSRVFPIIYKS